CKGFRMILDEVRMRQKRAEDHRLPGTFRRSSGEKGAASQERRHAEPGARGRRGRSSKIAPARALTVEPGGAGIRTQSRQAALDLFPVVLSEGFVANQRE